MTKFKEFIGDSDLRDFVVRSILENAQGYNGSIKERINGFLNDLMNHGCVSGIVNGMIYYSETTDFFEKYKYEINEMLYDCGLSVKEFLGSCYDDSDPLCIEATNQNYLAWFAYQDVAVQFYDYLND